MRPLLLRCPPGCLATVLGSFSASRNKLVPRAAAGPRLLHLTNTMHYQTEARGRPGSPDYRVYFSKFIIATVGGTRVASALHGVTVQHQDPVWTGGPRVDLRGNA